MVAQKEIARVASLNQEYQSINQALYMFGDGAKILAMMIGVPQPEEIRQPTGFMMRTDHMAYPAQMVAGIVQQLNARRDAIRDELRQMGVEVPDRPPPPRPPEEGGGVGSPEEVRAQRAAAREARRAAARQPRPRVAQR